MKRFICMHCNDTVATTLENTAKNEIAYGFTKENELLLKIKVQEAFHLEIK